MILQSAQKEKPSQTEKSKSTHQPTNHAAYRAT
jgi:hypothetical protein